MQLRAKLFRGLADLSGLRVLETLHDGPLSAGEIVSRTRLSYRRPIRASQRARRQGR